MAIILILIATSILALVAAIIIGIFSKKHEDNTDLDLAHVSSSVLAFLLIVVTVCIGIWAIAESTNNSKYDALESRYEQICETYKFYRTRRNSNTSGVDAWLQEVYDYNNTVKEIQSYADNIWVNWFVNTKRASSLKYIEFEDGYPVIEDVYA